MKHRILMVVSSHGTLDDGNPTGGWLEELAASYWEFVDAGCEVTIASPQGGAAPVDPLSLQEPWLTPNGKRFQADAGSMAKLENTTPLASLRAMDFAAVYLVGGAATAWDFPDNESLARLVTTVFGAGRPVAGVCHGVLGLTGAKDTAGKLIVSDRRATGISNAEEALTGFDKLVPVMPENRLKALGARYSCAAPFESHVQVDGNLLTGQNPASAGPLALAILGLLGAHTL